MNHFVLDGTFAPILEEHNEHAAVGVQVTARCWFAAKLAPALGNFNPQVCGYRRRRFVDDRDAVGRQQGAGMLGKELQRYVLVHDLTGWGSRKFQDNHADGRHLRWRSSRNRQAQQVLAGMARGIGAQAVENFVGVALFQYRVKVTLAEVKCGEELIAGIGEPRLEDPAQTSARASSGSRRPCWL